VSNALVPSTQTDRADLIATSAQAPQTRARRRANPDEAIAAYDALGHWPTPAGRKLSRSL
jgi:hypothetical protein